MNFFLVFFCFLSISAGFLAQGVSSDQVCESGKYPPDPFTLVPTYAVNLDLAPELRWKALATEYAKPISALTTYIKAFILEFSPKLQKLIELVDNDLGKIVDDLPKPYGDEMKGIANATNVNLSEIVLYNIFYEIFTLCTSIVGQDSAGNIYHARNLDFGLFLGWDIKNDTWQLSELLRPLIVNINYTRGNVVQYTTVSFVGFVGLITGIRPGVLSITINERFEADGGYIGLFEWLLNINNGRQQAWSTLIARDMLDQGLDFNSAVKVLSSTPLIAPLYYIMAGPNNLQGSVVTRDREKAADIWMLGSNNTWFIAETNYDHWKAPLFVDDRITPANTCMNKLGQNSLSFAGLFNVLSSKPVLNKLTVYTALMELKTGRIETYIQFCPTPCDPF